MQPLSTDTTTDDTNADLLAEVQLHSFAAAPTTIGPFEESHLTWSVAAPNGVTILLDGATVAENGDRWVVPPTEVESFRLTAKAGNVRRLLGVVTVHVNLNACRIPETSLLDELLVGQIREKIDADTTGIRFRLIPVTTASGTSYVRSVPKVTVTTDKLSIDLQLEQRLDWLPDPAVDIHVDFGIEVIQSPNRPVGERLIAAINQHVDADVSVSPVTWWIFAHFGPDILQAKIDAAEQQARARGQQMIIDIVGGMDPRVSHGRNLNNFFAKPAGMEMERAWFYVDSGGLGTFAVRFCPQFESPSSSAGVGSLA